MLKELEIGEDIIVCNKTRYRWPQGIENDFNEGYFCGQVIGDGSFIKNKCGEYIPQVCLWVDKKVHQS